MDDGFGVDKCKATSAPPLPVGWTPSVCMSSVTVTIPYIPVVSVTRNRMGAPAQRSLCANIVSQALGGMWVRGLTRRRGQGAGQGGSQLGRPTYFVFRHMKHTITVTVVINLIFESLFMGHLG